jgi:2-polyprenyl-3-methyl-5-hydroxy-6-metoxy-1,4-benzoquinol methylase
VKDDATRDHYSYTLYADPTTARTFDDRRFGGPIGELIAAGQARVLGDFLGEVSHRRVLDVGSGTGRAALLLARAGANVTALDASEPMLAVARQRAADEGLPISFVVGDAHALDFPDRAFEVAVSFRVLMHTPGWRVCVGELCRVAARQVVIDYPSRSSLALFQAVARRVASLLGMRTEPYRVFGDREIGKVLAQHGFVVRARHRQFVLPIAVHKIIGSRRFTAASEAALDRLGLLSWFGSPVTLVAERCRPS